MGHADCGEKLQTRRALLCEIQKMESSSIGLLSIWKDFGRTLL
jgi:hypothetical protein